MKKAVISIVSALTGAALGAGAVRKTSIDKEKKLWALSDKHLSLYLMMDQWVKVKQEGKSLSSYFEENGYKKIAVYGMSYAGLTLIEELKDSGIEVAYGIDKNANTLYADVDIVSMDEHLEPVDVVVVTAITFFDEIEEALSERLDSPIISLEDILYEV